MRRVDTLQRNVWKKVACVLFLLLVLSFSIASHSRERKLNWKHTYNLPYWQNGLSRALGHISQACREILNCFCWPWDIHVCICLAEFLKTCVKKAQGPVVRRPISANPGLNFNPSLFFFSSKAFSRTIFSILFRVANHQIVDKKN